MEGKKIDLQEAYQKLEIFSLQESQREDPHAQTITWTHIFENKNDVYESYRSALGEPLVDGSDPFRPAADTFMSKKAYAYWLKLPGGTYAGPFAIDNTCQGSGENFTIEVGWKNKAKMTSNDLKVGTFVVFHEKDRRGEIYQVVSRVS